MRAAILTAYRQDLSIETVADPGCEADGVVLKVLACGICRSDWHGWMGHDADIKLPHVPGHELAGKVVAVPGGQHILQIAAQQDRVNA